MRMTTEATAATAKALTESPRDLPNAPADRQALGLVKPYLGMVAWPTVFVAIAIVSAFATVTTLGVMHIIPLWLGLILNTFILYLDQTPLHEACHGNIAGKDSKMLWLNHLVGYVCGAILLHEYKAFRYMHLAHHRDTNNEELDPDHWVAVQGPFKVLWRSLTIVYWYHQYFWKHIAFHTRHAAAHHPYRGGVLDPLRHRLLALGVRLVARGAGAVDRAAHPCLGADHLLLRLSHP